MDVTELYEQIILDHSKHPKGAGLREPYDAEAHHVNPTCGDEVTVRVALDGGKIRDVSYHGEGCSISRASASVLHELVQGVELEHTLAVQEAFQAMVTGRGQAEPDEELLEDAVAFAGVARYPMRVKCALLPWMAFKDAASRAVSGGKS
jgi:nitrogen fixation protein NifU and related proteins